MSEIAPIRQTLVVCVSDANLRRMQLPKRDRAIADAYIKGIFFSAAMECEPLLFFSKTDYFIKDEQYKFTWGSSPR
jgi:hypothetical protein